MCIIHSKCGGGIRKALYKKKKIISGLTVDSFIFYHLIRLHYGKSSSVVTHYTSCQTSLR